MNSPRGVWRAWQVALPAIVLALAVAVQATGVLRETPRPRDPHLARSVPAQVPGWSARDVPLGSSEFLANEAEKVLNYDEVINREYSRGKENFGVYVAYWGAGKMPTRLVASHTPDRCWTENGMHCLDMKFKVRMSYEGTALQPAEWRSFEGPTGGPPTYVLYWQLVNGRTYDYGDRFNAIPDPILWWKDAMQQVVLGSREQYFIRLTSSVPFESLWNDPGFDDVLHGLLGLGLAVGQPASTGNSARP
jgi:hypothetical protein